MLPVSDIQALYDSLLDASFRGVVFHVIDARHDVGRRMQRLMFPGIDLTVFQDYGALDGPVRITGLVSGDSYTHDAWKLHTAFRTAGPGTLVHPWLGELQVVLARPATISFAGKELRVARFEAEFLPYDALTAPAPNTLEQVLDAIDGVVAQARAWLYATLAPVAMALAAFGYAQSVVGKAIGWWNTVIGGADVIGPDAAPAIAALAATPQASPSTAWASATADALLAVPAAVADSSVPTPPAVVGPGQSAVTPAAADPAAATTVLLAMHAQVAALAADPAPGPAIAASLQAAIVAQAVRAASDIVFASQQDAIAWRDRLLAALDATAAAAAQAALLQPVAAGSLWRQMQALRAALLADMNATIGRLPAVVTVTPPASVSAWTLANALAGDTPAVVVAMYLDIVARNGLANPALMPAGPVEVLQ